MGPKDKMGFPDGSAGKEYACNAGDAEDLSSILGLVRYPGEGNLPQLSCQENPWTEACSRLLFVRSKTVGPNLATEQHTRIRLWMWVIQVLSSLGAHSGVEAYISKLWF